MGVMTEKASPQLITTEFDRWWNSSGIWVEPANKRRGGESGVQLLQQRDLMRPPLYCKRQIGHTYRTFLHPFGRPTILRELQAYRAFARLGIKTPNVVYCTARQKHGAWQALLVTEALQGFVSLVNGGVKMYHWGGAKVYQLARDGLLCFSGSAVWAQPENKRSALGFYSTTE